MRASLMRHKSVLDVLLQLSLTDSLAHASLTYASLMRHKKRPRCSVPDASILDAPDVLLQLSLTDSALNIPDAMCNSHIHLPQFPKNINASLASRSFCNLPSQTPHL